MDMKGRERAKKPGKADIKRELRGLKPQHTIEVDFSFLGKESEVPRKREEASQMIADRVSRAIQGLYPDATALFSIGSSGRIWSISTPKGRIQLSHRNEDGEKLRIDFYRFEQDSDAVRAVKESLKGILK